MGRYERNHPAISLEQQEILGSKRVLVAGCGGLGGYILEFLGRIGVGRLTAVDGDFFVDSNLNRQLLSSEETLGQPKPIAAAERMRLVNHNVTVTPVCEFIAEENACRIAEGHDVIVDALDNGAARTILAKAAAQLNIPLVSGAISGWRGRVFVLFPGDNAEYLWSGDAGRPSGNLCFTASATASVQASEAVKLLLEKTTLLHSRFLEFDLLTGVWEEIPLAF